MIKYKKYQTAGNTKKINKPIFVDDINDERYKAYRDSLNSYNGQMLYNKEILKLAENYPNGVSDEQFLKLRKLVKDKANHNLKYLSRDDTKPLQHGLQSPSYWQKIFNWKPPVQPVEYRPKTVTNKKVTSPPKKRIIDPSIVAKQKLIGTTPDGIWGPKSEEAWKQYQNRNIIPPIQSTPAPVVNNPQIINTPAQVIKPKSPKFKFVDDYTGPTYEMSKQDEIDFYNQRKKQYGGNLKYQVAGRTQLNKEFIEGVSNSKPKKTINKPDLYNNPTEIDNTKVNYQQAPIVYKTYPQNVNGKTVNVPTNQGTISQGNPDTFKDTLYNRSKNSKTFNNLANNLIVPITNIAGGLEGANLIKQGVKNIIKRIPKKVPLKVNDISNEIRLYNNTPTDNYKAIIDKGTNPIISKDIPDEPYPRMLHRKYTHGNPHDIHRFILKNKPLNGNGNNVIQKNNFKSDEGENFFAIINKEHYPGVIKSYRKTAKRPFIINDEIPGMSDPKHVPRRTTKLSNKLGKDHSLQLKRNYPDDGIEKNIEKYKFYKDLERYNIDISRINNIKNYLDKFDIIE